MGDEDEAPKRPMIAARERGPGPARYSLPPTAGFLGHDPSKHMSPAYSFGLPARSQFREGRHIPGPKYFIDPEITRRGKEGFDRFTMKQRHGELSTFKTPAPSQYTHEKVHPPNEAHAPVYSMGSRTRFRKKDTVPAASSYDMPALIGPRIPNKPAAAAHSFAVRPNIGGYSEDLARTPGPGAYTPIEPNVIKTKKPRYSFGKRTTLPGDTTVKPGPGTYKPEGVYINKPKAPAFPVGIRHSDFVTPLIVDVTD